MSLLDQLDTAAPPDNATRPKKNLPANRISGYKVQEGETGGTRIGLRITHDPKLPLATWPGPLVSTARHPVGYQRLC